MRTRAHTASICVLLLAVTVLSLLPPTPAVAATSDWDAPIDLTFPVTGDDFRYIDDYDFARSRGAHGATDIMAPPGTPIVAAVGGRITWLSTPSTSGCGYCLDITASSGRTFGYIHLGPKSSGRELEAFSRRWREGDVVRRGEVIGYVGCSGNASCSTGGHHLHFLIEDPGVVDPYGDHRRNPYASLRAAEACATDPGVTFRDACPSSVHHQDIEQLAASGLTSGCADELFCPQQGVTREQMASFLTRALEIRPRDELPFHDVERDNIHYADIAALAHAAITHGCGNGARYCPDDVVTRQEMASFLVRALGLAPRDTPTFTDVEASNPHARDIAALAHAGITKGCGGDDFCPTQPVTREQMASFLVRAFLG